MGASVERQPAASHHRAQPDKFKHLGRISRKDLLLATSQTGSVLSVCVKVDFDANICSSHTATEKNILCAKPLALLSVE